MRGANSQPEPLPIASRFMTKIVAERESAALLTQSADLVGLHDGAVERTLTLTPTGRAN
jgi:hypothetical protein